MRPDLSGTQTGKASSVPPGRVGASAPHLLAPTEQDDDCSVDGEPEYNRSPDPGQEGRAVGGARQVRHHEDRAPHRQGSDPHAAHRCPSGWSAEAAEPLPEKGHAEERPDGVRHGEGQREPARSHGVHQDDGQGDIDGVLNQVQEEGHPGPLHRLQEHRTT